MNEELAFSLQYKLACFTKQDGLGCRIAKRDSLLIIQVQFVIAVHDLSLTSTLFKNTWVKEH